MGGSRGIGEDTDQQFPPMGSQKNLVMFGNPSFGSLGAKKRTLLKEFEALEPQARAEELMKAGAEFTPGGPGSSQHVCC